MLTGREDEGVAVDVCCECFVDGAHDMDVRGWLLNAAMQWVDVVCPRGDTLLMSLFCALANLSAFVLVFAIEIGYDAVFVLQRTGGDELCTCCVW